MTHVRDTRFLLAPIHRPARLRAVTLVLIVALLVSVAASQARAQVVNILPLRISAVADVNGGLVARGTLGSAAFATTIGLTVTASASGAATLDITTAPIRVGVPGLTVRTTAIGLDVVGQVGTPTALSNLL